MDTRVKRQSVIFILWIMSCIVYLMYSYIFKPTTFDFDVEDMNPHYKSDYDAFYKSSDIIYGENFDISLKKLEKVDKGQVRAEFFIIGKTNTMYDKITISANFGISDIDSYIKNVTNCYEDIICTLYREDYGDEIGQNKYDSDINSNSDYVYEYKNLDDIGPLRIRFHYDFNQMGDELYDLMEFGYIVVHDQEGNMLDAIPFDFSDIINK